MLITHWCFSCCWAVLTLSQGFFSFSYYSASEEAGWTQQARRGHSQDSWPQLAKGIFHTMWHHAQYINWGELAGQHCGSRIGWVSASGWWAIVLCVTCFVYSSSSSSIFPSSSVVLNCLYLNPWVLGFFCRFSPPSHWVEGSDWVAAWCLIAGWG